MLKNPSVVNRCRVLKKEYTEESVKEVCGLHSEDSEFAQIVADRENCTG